MPIAFPLPEGTDTRKISYPTDDGEPIPVYNYENEVVTALDEEINISTQLKTERVQDEYQAMSTGIYAGKIWNREDLSPIVRWLWADNPDILANLGFIYGLPEEKLPRYTPEQEQRQAQKAVQQLGTEREAVERTRTAWGLVGMGADIGVAVALTKRVPGMERAASILAKKIGPRMGKAAVEAAVMSQAIELSEAARTGEQPTVKDLATSLAIWEGFVFSTPVVLAGGKALKNWWTKKSGETVLKGLHGVGDATPEQWYNAFAKKPGARSDLTAALSQLPEPDAQEFARQLLIYGKATKRGFAVGAPTLPSAEREVWANIYNNRLTGMERSLYDKFAKKATPQTLIRQYVRDKMAGSAYLQADYARVVQAGDKAGRAKINAEAKKLIARGEELSVIDPIVKEVVHPHNQALQTLKIQTGPLGHAINEEGAIWWKSNKSIIKPSNPESQRAMEKFTKAHDAQAMVYKERSKEKLRALHRFFNNPTANVERKLLSKQMRTTDAAQQVMADMSNVRGASSQADLIMTDLDKYFRMNPGELDTLNRMAMSKRILALDNFERGRIAKLTTAKLRIGQNVTAAKARFKSFDEKLKGLRAKRDALKKTVEAKKALKTMGAAEDTELTTALGALDDIVIQLQKVKGKRGTTQGLRGELKELESEYKEVKKGLDKPPYKAPMDMTRGEAEAFLSDIPPRLAEKLDITSNAVQKVYRDMLDQKLREGIISRADHAAMKKVGYYMQFRWLDKLDPVVARGGKSFNITASGKPRFRKSGQSMGDEMADLIDTQARLEETLEITSGAERRVVKAQLAEIEAVLKTQSQIHGVAVSDIYTLTRDGLNTHYNTVFRNRAAKAAMKMAEVIPDNGLFLKAIPGMEKPPMGWIETHALIDGVSTPFYVEQSIAREWMGMTGPMQQHTLNWVSWLSGSKAVKFMATGPGNPLWGFTNAMLDTGHAYMTMYQYSDFLPKYVWQMGKDIRRVAKPAIQQKGIYRDYFAEGGGLPLMYNEEYFNSTKMIAPGKARRSFRALGTAINSFNAHSEINIRLATTRRGVQKQVEKNLAKKLGRNLTGKELRSIDRLGWNDLKKRVTHDQLRVSVAAARNRTDFPHAGDFWRLLDAGMSPYSKAGFVAEREVYRGARANKARFLLRAGQVAGLTAAITIGNMTYNREAYNTLTTEDKIRDWNISTGLSFKNAKGEEEHIFLKYRKDQTMRAVSGITEGLVSEYYGGQPYDWPSAGKAFQEMYPYNPEVSSAPVLYGILIQKTGRDPRTGKKVLPSGVTEQGPQNRELEWDENIHGAWVKLGEKTGLSPYRTKRQVQQVMTYNNPAAWILGAATIDYFRELPDSDKQEFAEQLMKSPLLKSVIKTRTASAKYYKYKEASQWEVAAEKGEISRAVNLAIKMHIKNELPLEAVAKLIDTSVPLEYQKSMRGRVKKWLKLADGFRRVEQQYPQGTPFSIETWMSFANMPPEERAIAYNDMYRDSTPDMRRFLRRLAINTPLFITERFQYRIDKINEQKGEQ